MYPVRNRKSKALNMLPIIVGFSPKTYGLDRRFRHQYIQLDFAQADAGQRRETVAVPLYKLEGLY